ncbi:hypothetical protein OE88DRAFT_1075322 [Heliocybe sulcata]|uniref:Uncharacterized protein n=1 Tax=Heliocybe sulcata TaxID=5364 RepID=A0A5C3MKX0_9AGAM|nr:hypothetical protein OE88DRAFT_1075322 [Heliocybe sulcata]
MSDQDVAVVTTLWVRVGSAFSLQLSSDGAFSGETTIRTSLRASAVTSETFNMTVADAESYGVISDWQRRVWCVRPLTKF